MPMTYDRYTVSIPGDLADNLEALGDQAITEARERENSTLSEMRLARRMAMSRSRAVFASMRIVMIFPL